MTRPGWRGHRGLLRNAVISSAAPYGYTLTTWTTGLPATQAAAAAPTTADALLIAVPGMISRGYRRIVYLGAVLSQRPREGMIAVGTSKAALSSFARFVAQELGPRGIAVNVVAPGPVGGHLHNAALEHDREHKQRLAAQTALGRLANPDDVVRAVAFYAGDDSGFITGTTAPVDGGLALD